MANIEKDVIMTLFGGAHAQGQRLFVSSERERDGGEREREGGRRNDRKMCPSLQLRTIILSARKLFQLLFSPGAKWHRWFGVIA